MIIESWKNKGNLKLLNVLRTEKYESNGMSNKTP
jgi:hypothetical protein